MSKKPTIIGIDGGASKVNAHVVDVAEDKKRFSLAKYNSIKEYGEYSEFQEDFTPVDLPIQLSQINENNIILTQAENEHAKAYYSAFIDAITEIIKITSPESLLIGIGMPGVKSTDKRGIVAMANGPRMPNFAAKIEQRLSNTGITLAQPITKLGSDADYCGIGEEYAEQGAFKEFENAYYLGGGTGAADALKLNGKLISLDNCKSWIAKTWEYSDENGNSMERYCSAKGIQSIYGELKGIAQAELSKDNIYLEQIITRAVSDEKEAVETWQIVNIKIAELLFERISTIYSGWQNNFSFINQNKQPISPNHQYEKTLLDRIIIGQRLGTILSDPIAITYFLEPLKKNLSELISKSNSLDDHAKSHYLDNSKFNHQIIMPSQLHEAPALGAGIDAFRNFKL